MIVMNSPGATSNVIRLSRKIRPAGDSMIFSSPRNETSGPVSSRSSTVSSAVELRKGHISRM
jgi:hypothetical protein